MQNEFLKKEDRKIRGLVGDVLGLLEAEATQNGKEAAPQKVRRLVGEVLEKFEAEAGRDSAGNRFLLDDSNAKKTENEAARGGKRFNLK